MPPWMKKKFKLLRLTVRRCAGTGKSVLINTIVGCICKMFNSNNCAFVVAPTGAAAHNVGGQTIHHEFKVNINKKKKKISLSEKAKIQLMEKLMFTIAVFFDE